MRQRRSNRLFASSSRGRRGPRPDAALACLAVTVLSIGMALGGFALPALADATPSPGPESSGSDVLGTPADDPAPGDRSAAAQAPADDETADAPAADGSGDVPAPVEQGVPAGAAPDGTQPADDAADGGDSVGSPAPAADVAPPPAPAAPGSSQDPAADAAKSAARVAPEPLVAANPATITISTGGTRTGTSGVTPLAGAQFDVWAGTRGSAPVTTGDPSGTCSTGPDGTCDVSVPALTGGSGGATAGYWVVERSAPAGWSPLGELGTGDYDSGKAITPYRYFTNNLPPGGSIGIPGSAAAVPQSSPGGNVSSWANVKHNGTFPQRCGVSIAMVFDTSASISAGEMTSLKDAARSFVGDGGLGSTPSTVSMFSFSTSAIALTETPIPLTDDAGIASAVTQIDALPDSGDGYTNWDAALQLVAADGDAYDLVLFLTDGDPTRDATGKQNTVVQPRFVENAVFSANELKSKTGPGGAPTMVLPVGIGLSTNSDLNLMAISGPTAGQDYVLVSDFAALEARLKEIATASCGGTLTVHKVLQDADGTVIDDTPAGWTFAATGEGVSGAAQETSDLTGSVNFPVSFGDYPSARTIDVAETQRPGYTLAESSCTGGDGYAATELGFTVTVAPEQVVSCTVVNRLDPPSWTITKTSDPASGSSVDPGSSIGYSVTVTNTGSVGLVDAPIHDDLGAVLDNATTTEDSVSMSASGTASILPDPIPQISGGALDVTIPLVAPGESVSIGYRVTLDPAAFGVTLTNVVTGGTENQPPERCGPSDAAHCSTTHHTPDGALLTLTKVVDAGATGSRRAPGDWTLTATPDAIAGQPEVSGNGSTGVVRTVVRAGDYTLSEAGPSGFSAGAWSCEGGPLDEASRVVTVPRGGDVSCSITNTAVAPTLTLVKVVAGGGTQPGATPGQWLLSASGPVTISGRSADSAVTDAPVSVGSYALAESGGPMGYRASAWVCTGTGSQQGASITLAEGQRAVCTITNTAVQQAVPMGGGAVADPSPSRPKPPVTAPTRLPNTGINAAVELAGGVLLLVAGAASVLWARRRRGGSAAR